MKDNYGEYQILTGNEGSGKCWWCGGKFPDSRHRRYCSSDCSIEYYRHYFWAGAVKWALERAGNKCQECDSDGITPGYFTSLEVHHRDPLNNDTRFINIKNRPENLIVLCRKCHGKSHTKDIYDKAKEKGQAIMELT